MALFRRKLTDYDLAKAHINSYRNLVKDATTCVDLYYSQTVDLHPPIDHLLDKVIFHLKEAIKKTITPLSSVDHKKSIFMLTTYLIDETLANSTIPADIDIREPKLSLVTDKLRSLNYTRESIVKKHQVELEKSCLALVDSMKRIVEELELKQKKHGPDLTISSHNYSAFKIAVYDCYTVLNSMNKGFDMYSIVEHENHDLNSFFRYYKGDNGQQDL